MATSYLLRAVTYSTKFFLGVVHRDASNAYRCLPFMSVTHKLIVSRTYASFITRVTADELWAGVTSVSNPGRKRGRGRSVKKKVDLNRGQRIGKGKAGVVFPGLDGPALVGTKHVNIHKLDFKGDDSAENKPQLRRKHPRIPALQRGYSGRKFPGTCIGPPDPINDYQFEGFETRVLEYKMVAHMTGNLGRKSNVSALVVTGNGNGLGGYAVAKAPVGKAALRKAKNTAAQKLQYFERCNDHTVFHDYAVTEHKTTIYVQKMPKGYGLKCHRVLKSICQTIGIEDLYAKTEGRPGNVQNLTKAFFRGLMEQETHQQLADRMKLNVVEYRAEMDNFPIAVATPSQGFSRPDPIKEEAFDFENLYYKDGKIPLKKVRHSTERQVLPSYLKHCLKVHRDRNQRHAYYLRVVHGFQPSTEELKERKRPLK